MFFVHKKVIVVNLIQKKIKLNVTVSCNQMGTVFMEMSSCIALTRPFGTKTLF